MTWNNHNCRTISILIIPLQGLCLPGTGSQKMLSQAPCKISELFFLTTICLCTVASVSKLIALLVVIWPNSRGEHILQHKSHCSQMGLYLASALFLPLLFFFWGQFLLLPSGSLFSLNNFHPWKLNSFVLKSVQISNPVAAGLCPAIDSISFQV